MPRGALVIGGAIALLCGCGVREVAPPSAPAAIVPKIPDVPEAPPTDGKGRLLLDTEDEPAKVERVIERVDPPEEMRAYAPGSPLYGVKTELVCITPCAFDAPTGAASLVFTSLRDVTRRGTADVTIARGTTVVRHRLGTQTTYQPGYLAGIFLTPLGAALSLMGGIMLGIGASGEPMVDENGHKTDPAGLALAGGVIAVAGLGALAGGVLLLSSERPVHQPGATTTFREPASE